MKLKQLFKFYLLPILSGIFIGTSYIPFPPWALFFCLIPLFRFFQGIDNYKQAFIGGWITQFILNMIGFHWIGYTASEFGHLHWSLSTLVLLAFAATAHLYFPIAGVLFVFLKRKLKLEDNHTYFFLPLCFLAMDGIFPMIFRWHFGYPWLWVDAPGAQMAELIGFVGIHVYTVFCNVGLMYIWDVRKVSKKRMKQAVGAFFTTFILFNGLGYLLKERWQKPDEEVKFLVVQGNIGNLEKAAQEHGSRFIDKIVTTYTDLTYEGLRKHPDTDFVLWPETAFPEYLDSNYHHRFQVKRLKEVSKSTEVPIFTGGYSKNQKTRQIYNSLFLLGSDGEIAADPYFKTHLLAFGEYLPFGDVFPSLKKALSFISDFGRGQGPYIFEYEGYKIGPQICYEGLFPPFSAELSAKGAQIFMNITNDSWFGYPFEPYQHLYMTFARAIEFRRPLVRSTNTGLTTAIDALGKVTPHGPRNSEWYGLFTLPYNSNPDSTLYSHFAGGWPYILNFLLIIMAGIRFARTRKH